MEKVHCRFCGTELWHVFADLGLSPMSNEYLLLEDSSKGQYFYPLVVHVCEKCYLVQAMEFSKPEAIFSNYKYFSSFSKSWLEHCKRYVDMIVASLELSTESLVTEIACNDGYLLQYFKPYGVPVYGVEPSENVALEAQKREIDVEVSFFGDELARILVEKRGKSDLVIGNNVLAHVPDINGFVKGLKTLLADGGVITVEFPHLLKLVQYIQFDTIYHEHFYYFSLLALTKIFKAHKLKIFRVDELDTHGGSLRVYAAHDKDTGREVEASVTNVLEAEQCSGLGDMRTYAAFGDAVTKIKRESLRLLSELKGNGESIAAYGAAAKGNTFLNYCGIGKDFVDYVVDANPHKQGLYLPGTQIPIVGKEKLSETKPGCIIILPWNIRGEIEAELIFAREWGCRLITFIPEVQFF